MISVILYGRNDAHGYNLHRRAALSLNCIAEVLTAPGDELIFVDYNTPDELPTFIEAISDTLTERCLGLLRVLRIPAAIHEQRFADRTHLPAVEPVARNVAARRANPSNRWLLSTNTDMIFVPLGAGSMSDICADLPDGFYGLPRFEMPEWLWERLPRSDPRRALAEIQHLGPGLTLDESTTSHEWIRFDAPGDFQLILREDFVAIDGFNEEMLLGYHVDSNMSRRLLLRRGSIESLETQLASYHCNHNRTLTVYHGRRVENDVQTFFYMVDRPSLPEQQKTWGLAGVNVHEVPVREGVDTRSAARLVETMPSRARSRSDAMEAPFLLTYDSGHVLPFIVDSLIVSSRDAAVGYMGANQVLGRMLADTVGTLGFERPLAIAKFEDLTGIERIAETADILIVDLGVDVSEAEPFLRDLSRREFGEIPPGLVEALPALDRLVQLERSRYERMKQLRPVVLVNSTAAFWEPFVLAQFDCSYTTVHSRVRRATIKRVPGADAAELRREYERSVQLMRWSTRDKGKSAYLPLPHGGTVELAHRDDYGGFGTGWSPPEAGGVWTLGSRAELRIGLDGIDDGEYVLSLLIGMICVGPAHPLTVELLVNGESAAIRRFTDSAAGGRWRVALPSRVVTGDKVELTLLVADPQSPLALEWSSDDRALGMHVLTLTVAEPYRAIRVGETVVFTEGSKAEDLLGDGWAALEPTGVWTVEETAVISLRLADPRPVDVDVVLDLVPFVTRDHPALGVEVWAHERRVAAHVFRYGDSGQPLRVHLPAAMMDEEGRAVLELRVHEPARPVDVGLSDDPRRLGVHLQSLAIRQPMTAAAVKSAAGTLRKLRKQLRRSLRS